MKTELTADAVIRKIGEMCEFTDCGARTLSQKIEPLIRSFESEIRAQCEAAKRENAELRAALSPFVKLAHGIPDNWNPDATLLIEQFGNGIRVKSAYKSDPAFPTVGQWLALRQQEVQG